LRSEANVVGTSGAPGVDEREAKRLDTVCERKIGQFVVVV
jgi:hypothetical protein